MQWGANGNPGSRLVVCVMAACLGATPASAAADALPWSRWSLDLVAESYGRIRERRLLDGRAPAPQSPIDDFVAALLMLAGEVAAMWWAFGTLTGAGRPPPVGLAHAWRPTGMAVFTFV